MTIEAMKLALEALEHEAEVGNDNAYLVERNALRAAIEQAQDNDFNPDWDAMAVMVAEQQRMAKRIAELETQPEQEPVQELVCVCGAIWEGQELISATSQRQWQGLTDEEIAKVRHLYDGTAGWTIEIFARAIEAKLKEKNT